jgi:hypothetical protein
MEVSREFTNGGNTLDTGCVPYPKSIGDGAGLIPAGGKIVTVSMVVEAKVYYPDA